MKKAPALKPSSCVALAVLAVVLFCALSTDAAPQLTTKADFVVVGTGAGSVPVIRKLIDAGFSVIALEAGTNEDNNPLVYNPVNFRAVSGTRKTTYGWILKSDPEVELNGRAYEPSLGRLLGGCTSHNGMMYVRGSPAYFELWEEFVDTDKWNTSIVQQAYIEMEKYNNEQSGPKPGRGLNGPVDIRRPVDGPATGVGSLANFLAESCTEASGLPFTPDYNGNTDHYGIMARFDLFQTPNKRRVSSSSAFLGSDVMNPDGTGKAGKKLKVYFKATGQRLTYDKHGRANGVIALINGVQKTIQAKREVILGGNLQSAHILQASGIGNATLLNSVGIPVRFNSPNVGRNLANHPAAIVAFRYNETAYGGFFAPGDEESMFAGGGFYPAVKADGTFEAIDESKPREFQTIWMPNTGGRVNFYSMLARPKSTGYYLVQSTDPLLFPLLNEQTFSVADDLEQLARFLFHYVQNSLAPELASKDPSFVPDWPHWNTIDDTKAWLRNNVGKATHYAGSNRMSRTAATGVVDYQGRVHGVPGLRVIDTTIIPTIPDGNTGAVGFMLGWVIGDKIVDQYS